MAQQNLGLEPPDWLNRLANEHPGSARLNCLNCALFPPKGITSDLLDLLGIWHGEGDPSPETGVRILWGLGGSWLLPEGL